jgi:hypothetical protein
VRIGSDNPRFSASKPKLFELFHSLSWQNKPHIGDASLLLDLRGQKPLDFKVPLRFTALSSRCPQSSAANEVPLPFKGRRHPVVRFSSRQKREGAVVFDTSK